MGSAGRAAGRDAAGGCSAAQVLVILCAWPQQRDDIPMVRRMKEFPVCLLSGSLGISKVPNRGSAQEALALCVETV